MRNDFAVLILSHKRAGNIKTIETLNKVGYTGKIYIIVDNLDNTIEEYKEAYGDRVVIFDKLQISKTFDIGDNFDGYISTSYVRNAMHEIARNLGLNFFIQLDDDYTEFAFRFNSKHQYCYRSIKHIDKVFEAMVDFVSIPKVLTLAMAQGGDFIGGKDGSYAESIKLTRKGMNSFVCKTDTPFKFLGRMNEDVNMYIMNGIRGNLIFTTNFISLNQTQTQRDPGGMSTIYLDLGTYVKSFYSVMFAPSCAKICIMNTVHPRIHHKISWNNCIVKILKEEYKNV